MSATPANKEPVTFWLYIVGTAITTLAAIGAPLLTYRGVLAQIEAQREQTKAQIETQLKQIEAQLKQTKATLDSQAEQNRLNEISKILSELTVAINKVDAQLGSFEFMYLEMARCLKDGERIACWGKDYGYFDPRTTAEAWDTIAAISGRARPYLRDRSEVAVFDDLRKIKEEHQKAIGALLPATSPEQAMSIQTRTRATRLALQTKSDEVTKRLSAREKDPSTGSLSH